MKPRNIIQQLLPSERKSFTIGKSIDTSHNFPKKYKFSQKEKIFPNKKI